MSIVHALIENAGHQGWASQPADDDAYYPDGQVAHFGLSLSPVSQGEPPERGPDNRQQFQSAYAVDPAGGIVDDPVVWSREQGVGRSPGQQWPHMPHVVQLNFESTTGIAWHDGMVGVPADSEGSPWLHASPRQGWALTGPQAGGTYYYGQGPAQHRWVDEPISIGLPSTRSYTEMTEVPPW